MRPSLEYVCDPPAARLRITGEVDLSARDELTDMFLRFALRGCTFVELDLSGVTFLDAYPLGVFRCEQRRLRKLGGDLRVVAASPWCAFLCRLAQYDSLTACADHPPSLRVLPAVPQPPAQRRTPDYRDDPSGSART